MKALILDGKVVDLKETEFDVHSSMSWVDCDDIVEVGNNYDGSTFTTHIVQLTAEQNLERLRVERNKLLKQTDWLITMHKELGTNIPAAWKTYRQALRDITDTYTSLDDVVWPEKPE
jgi:hypothetical protein